MLTVRFKGMFCQTLAVQLASLTIICGCTSSAAGKVQTNSDCVRVQLAKLFSAPMKYNKRVICTQGYFNNRGQPVLHTKKSPSRDEYYKFAMRLDPVNAELDEQLESLSRGVLVAVKGRLSVPTECWFLLPKLPDDEEYICVPFNKPLDLEVTEIFK